MPAAAAVDTVTPAMSAIIVFFNDLNSFITKQSPLINSYLRIPKKAQGFNSFANKKGRIRSSFVLFFSFCRLMHNILVFRWKMHHKTGQSRI